MKNRHIARLLSAALGALAAMAFSAAAAQTRFRGELPYSPKDEEGWWRTADRHRSVARREMRLGTRFSEITMHSRIVQVIKAHLEKQKSSIHDHDLTGLLKRDVRSLRNGEKGRVPHVAVADIYGCA